jgi:hypothetical protein
VNTRPVGGESALTLPKFTLPMSSLDLRIFINIKLYGPSPCPWPKARLS